jgi:hypothetical protein
LFSFIFTEIKKKNAHKRKEENGSKLPGPADRKITLKWGWAQARIGSPKFWYDLIRPSHPAVTTTRPHVSVPLWQATFKNFNRDLDKERGVAAPGEIFSSGHVAFPLLPCESSCMEMRTRRSIAGAPFQGTAREEWSDMNFSEDRMSFPECKLLVTWDVEFNK